MSRILSARNKSASLSIALEGLEDADPAIVMNDEPVSSELDQDQDELQEAAGDVDEAHEVIEELEESATGLESIALALESTVADGGLTPQSAMFMNIAVGQATAKLGLTKSVVPSMESFGGDTTRLAATNISMESIGELISKIWEAIKKAYATVVAAVKGFFDRMFNVAPRVKAKAEALKKKLEGLKGTPQGKIKIGGAASRIAIAGKIQSPAAVLTLFKAFKERQVTVMDIDAKHFTKKNLESEEGKAEFSKAMVSLSAANSKGYPGINESFKSEGNERWFKSAVMPGNQVFVLKYELAKAEDAPATAVSRAVGGFVLSREGADKNKQPKDGLQLAPLTETEMHSYLDIVIEMCDAAIGAKADIASLESSSNEILEKIKTKLDKEGNDEGVCAAYIRAAGKAAIAATRLPYEIAKYGAETMQSYLIVVDESINAHGEKEDKKAA